MRMVKQSIGVGTGTLLLWCIFAGMSMCVCVCVFTATGQHNKRAARQSSEVIDHNLKAIAGISNSTRPL